MNWQQKIEALIALLHREKFYESEQMMQALLDVAVAANEYEIWCIKVGMPINKHVQKALDTLREVGDGH